MCLPIFIQVEFCNSVCVMDLVSLFKKCEIHHVICTTQHAAHHPGWGHCHIQEWD